MGVDARDLKQVVDILDAVDRLALVKRRLPGADHRSDDGGDVGVVDEVF